MAEKIKISPFQLFCLLLAGRLFTLLLWPYGTARPGEMLLAILLAPVVQLLLALLLGWFFREQVWQGSSKLLHKGVLWVCWVGCMVTAALTAGSCGGLLAGSYYQQSFGLVAVVALVLAAALAACLGLEGLARTAPVLLVAAGLALVLLLAGSVGQAHLVYLPVLTADPMETTRQLLLNSLTSWELLLLPLLAPHATKPMKKRAVAVWLGLSALVQLLVAVAVLLVLGQVATGQGGWPVYTLARAVRLALTQRMDALLLGAWVLLGFLRCAVALWLAGALWGRLGCRVKKPVRLPLLHGLAAGVAALLLFAGCSPRETIGQRAIATMLELSYAGGRCEVSVEYRQPARQKDQPAHYGVYTATGDTLAQALDALEEKHSVTLWLDSCRVATLVGDYDPQTTTWLLEQLATQSDLRPLTALLHCPEPLLEPGTADKENDTGTATQLLRLFAGHGGVLSGQFTLKDTTARHRDPLLAVLLPVVEAGEEGPLLTEFWAMDDSGTATFTVAELRRLPFSAFGDSKGRRADPDTTAQIVEKIQNREIPDILSLQKLASLGLPPFWPWR